MGKLLSQNKAAKDIPELNAIRQGAKTAYL